MLCDGLNGFALYSFDNEATLKKKKKKRVTNYKVNNAEKPFVR